MATAKVAIFFDYKYYFKSTTIDWYDFSYIRV
jgi:hypothetical protein